MPSIVLIGLLLVAVWLALRRDFQKGFLWALVLFSFVTNRLILPGGGGFELTFQRLLLVLVTLYWIVWITRNPHPGHVPFLGLVVAWWVANLLSLVFAAYFDLSVKWFVSFSTEFILYYVIVATSVTNLDDALRTFRTLCFSSTLIAVLATIEYYSGLNPFIAWVGIAQPSGDGDVLVTFQHRILLGYAMAMGWPLLLALALDAPPGRARMLGFAATMAALGSCYFSSSRGPWFAAALAGVVMCFAGSGSTRKVMRIFAVLTLVVLVLRPGVRATIYDLTNSTFDPDSYRGRSYYYRKELWPAAFDLVKASAGRFLFGYGGLATEKMDLSARFQYGGNSFRTGYSSWDNNYAADLVEFGYVGLALEAAFYACVLVASARAVRRCPPVHRDKAAAVFTAAVVYAFALTNVYMFSPQLKCLFLALAVVGNRLGDPVSQPAEEPAETTDAVPDPDPLTVPAFI